MCNINAGSNFSNPYNTQGAAGGSSSMALAIAINLPGQGTEGAAAASSSQTQEAGKNGKHGKAGKHGKNGKHGKAGKNGKNGKNEANYQSPLHRCDQNSAGAFAGAGSGFGGCSPCGSGQGSETSQLVGLLLSLLSGGQQDGGAMAMAGGGGMANFGQNPGMGGFLNQFGGGGRF